MKPSIGMRSVKTALAVILSIVISKALHSEYPFFAAIAAVISMESTVTSSFNTGRNRIMGTLVGAGTGLLFALIRPDDALLCGLGVIVIIFVSNMMQWKHSIAIATIVFLSVMLNLGGDSPWIYGVNRIEDTLLGISVALAVNYLVFPYNIAKQLIAGERALNDRVHHVVRQQFCLEETVSLEALLQEIVRLEEQYALYASEFRIGKKEDPRILEIREKLVVYRDLYAHLKMLMRLDGRPCLDPLNTGRINGLGYEQIPEGCVVEDDLNTVYNYHVGKILDDLQSVSA